MPNIYVDSAGSNTSPYDTWAKAATTLAAAAAIDAAGDMIYVKSTHSESTAGAVTLDWAGTVGSPVRVLCVSDSNEPPTTLATGAVVAVTGANNLTLASSGDVVYFYGIRFKAGDGTNAASIALGTSSCAYESCALELAGNSSNSDVTGSGAYSFKNCTFKSVNAGSTITTGIVGFFDGCSIESGTTAETTLFDLQGVCYVIGCDFSNMGSATNLVSSTGVQGRMFHAYNCKMPSSWSGSVNGGTGAYLGAYILTNSDAADTNYRLEKKTQFGTVTHDTGIYLTAGASDGTTHISWKMVSNANAEWLHQTLDSPEIVQWNETTGSALTVTCEFLIDSATTLNNNDVWMEVMYLGTSGFPLGSIDIDSRAANYLSTPAECTTGAGTGSWTGEAAGAKSYKLVSTITPQEKGFIHATVKLAKASTTIYVDPKLTVA